MGLSARASPSPLRAPTLASVEPFEAFARTADLRRQAADLLDTLTPEQWEHPSLCGAWTVRDVAAHLVVPLTVSLPAFALAMVKARGDFDRANDALARGAARRLGDQVAATLRERAHRRFVPPGGTASFQLVDVIVHSQDIRRPLGLTHAYAASDLREALTVVTSPGAERAFTPRRRLEGLALLATDTDEGEGPFRFGEGAPVVGPAEAILLALTGRRVALADLEGAGVALLSGRLTG